jgi:hypothetical protein
MDPTPLIPAFATPTDLGIRTLNIYNFTAVKELCEGAGFLSEMPYWMWWALGFIGGMLFCLLIVQVWQLILVRKEVLIEKAEAEKKEIKEKIDETDRGAVEEIKDEGE